MDQNCSTVKKGFTWKCMKNQNSSKRSRLLKPSAWGNFSAPPTCSTRPMNGCEARSTSLWVHRNLFWQPSRDGNLHGSGMSHVTTASPKPSVTAPWRVGDVMVGRGNVGWTTSKSGHPCPSQNRSQWPLAEKTGKGSLVNHLSCPLDDSFGWTQLNRYRGDKAFFAWVYWALVLTVLMDDLMANLSSVVISLLTQQQVYLVIFLRFFLLSEFPILTIHLPPPHTHQLHNCKYKDHYFVIVLSFFSLLDRIPSRMYRNGYRTIKQTRTWCQQESFFIKTHLLFGKRLKELIWKIVFCWMTN